MFVKFESPFGGSVYVDPWNVFYCYEDLHASGARYTYLAISRGYEPIYVPVVGTQEEIMERIEESVTIG